MINDSKERLGKFISKLFGLDLDPIELEEIWIMAQERKLTAIGENPSIVASPNMIEAFVKSALKRTGLTIEDKRFKKIREEIIPAIDFVLFLKLIGNGEHFILSSDAPDIILVKLDQHQRDNPKEVRKIPATPLEITFIKEHSLKGITGLNDTERVAKAIASQKFNKSYDPHTSLLVVLDVNLGKIVLNNLSSLLSVQKHNFHSIWIYMMLVENKSVIAQLFPTFRSREFDIETDLRPLSY